MDIGKLKQFSDFAISNFYINVFKPFLKDILDDGYKSLDEVPTSEFESLKRDLKLHAKKEFYNIIIGKVENSSEKLNKLIAKGEISFKAKKYEETGKQKNNF